MLFLLFANDFILSDTLSQYILSGGPDPTASIYVDDDLVIYLNGNIIFQDLNYTANFNSPIKFYACPGDRLRIVAIDQQYCRKVISPIYLHFDGEKKLVANGIDVSACPGHATYDPTYHGPWPNIFLDKTFMLPIAEKAGLGFPKDRNVGQGDDVNIINGNMYSIIQDLSIPGKGFSTEFSRTYNSNSIYNGSLGYGWTHNYNILLTENPDGSITERDEDETLIDFVYEDAWKDGVLDKVDISTGEVKLIKTLEGTDLPQPSNIQAFWKFEESSGTIHDESINNNDGTYNGLLYRQPGKIGYALGFDGVDDYMNIGNIGIGANGTATIGGWFYFKQFAQGSLFKGLSQILYQHPANNNFYIYGTNDYFAVASALRLNAWHHIALTYSGDTSTAKIYIDGMEYNINQQPGPHDIDVLSSFTIGKDLTLGYFNGVIDEVVVWDKALTASEISSLQNPSIYEFKYALSGTMIIKFNVASTQSWKSYAFVGDESNGTNINVRFRSSDTEPGLETATWSQYYDGVTDAITDVADGQWVEIELTLKSNPTQTYTPALKRFIINYSEGSKIWESGYKAWDRSIITKNPDGTYILTRKGGTKYNFNSSGSLISIIDRNNNQITLTYTDGLLTTITDTSGRIVNLRYTGGRIIEITDPANRLITYSYDVNNNLIQVRDPSNNTTAYAYDIKHNLITITYANGGHVYFAYDDEDRCIETKRDGDNQKFTFSYDPDNSTTTMTDANGNQKVFIYNKEKGVVTSITDALGNVTTSIWDEDINRTSITQP